MYQFAPAGVKIDTPAFGPGRPLLRLYHLGRFAFFLFGEFTLTGALLEDLLHMSIQVFALIIKQPYVAIIPDSGPGRDQVSDDHVLLESAQEVR
jgi:hypothetical protein